MVHYSASLQPSLPSESQEAANRACDGRARVLRGAEGPGRLSGEPGEAEKWSKTMDCRAGMAVESDVVEVAVGCALISQ